MADRIFQSLLIHTCDIKRRSVSTTRDALGKLVESFTTVSTGTLCRIEIDKENSKMDMNGKHVMTRATGFFEIDVDIQEDDIVTWNSVDYKVRGTPDAGAANHHYEVFLTRLDK